MIMPKYLPPNSYFDDPADKLDHADRAASDQALQYALAAEGFTVIGEWITRGRNRVKQRALRSDIVLLCISRQFLPTERPCGAWVGRQHGVSRQRVDRLWKEFAKVIAPYIQFRGQRFLNQAGARQKERRGRGR